MSDKNNGLWSTNNRDIPSYYFQIIGSSEYIGESLSTVSPNPAEKVRILLFDKVHKSKATYLLPEEVLT